MSIPFKFSRLLDMAPSVSCNGNAAFAALSQRKNTSTIPLYMVTVFCCMRIVPTCLNTRTPLVCQLGHGSGSNGRHAPKRVESLKKFTVVGVATGTEHTAVVTRSGNVRGGQMSLLA